ncbi:hypothetical protein JW964_12100, partial [candidate division KSB1 bacterium]|nr:hypothetical protein [candidate division KSB1 bacterium]
MLRPAIRMLLTIVEAFCFGPVLFYFICDEYFQLRTNFSGVGIGSIIILMSHAFRWYVIQLLGPFYTADIAVFQHHRIVEAGWYKIIRHPQYLANFISYIGLSICFNG